MGPSVAQWVTINSRIRRWGRALLDAAGEHGAPNSFGIQELVGSYADLQPREGYYLGNCRCRELSQATGYVVTYSQARFHVERRVEL